MKRRGFLKFVAALIGTSILPRGNALPAEGGYIADPPPLVSSPAGHPIFGDASWAKFGGGLPAMVHFCGDGAVRTFAFSRWCQARSTDSIKVWVDGECVDCWVALRKSGMTFQTAPKAGAAIVAFYERA